MKSEERNAVAAEMRILTGLIAKEANRDTERRLARLGAGISGLQFGVLRKLAHKRRTLSELSRLMMLSPATLVPVVDALEVKGLVQRGQERNDRRRNPLIVTPRGIALLDRVPYIDSGDLLVAALAKMGDRKSRELLTCLQELARLISKDEKALDEALAITRSQL